MVAILVALAGLVALNSVHAFVARSPAASFMTNTRLHLTDYTPLDGEQKINLKQDLDSPKVASMEEVCKGDKRVYCRCWLSESFPLCDGQHVKHNAATGDNVGPLIVSVPKGASTETKNKGNPKSDDEKAQGRKKRVIIGYKVTSVAYLVYAVAVLVQKIDTKSLFYYASGQVVAAGVAYILSSAASNNRLASDTYKRLNLCLGEYGLIGIATALVAQPQFGRNIFLVVPAVLATINSVKGYTYGVLGFDKKNTETGLVKDFVQGTISTFKGMVSMPKNVAAFGYLGATVMVGALKFVKLVEIIRLVQGGAGGLEVATRLSRFGRLAFLTIILYTLKDAADRNRLEGTTFIELNALSSLALATMSDYFGVTTRLGGLAAFFSAFAAFQGVSSVVKKKQAATK